MVVVRLEDYDDLVALRLWEAGTLGVTEGDGFVDAFFEDVEAASRFGEPKADVRQTETNRLLEIIRRSIREPTSGRRPSWEFFQSAD